MNNWNWSADKVNNRYGEYYSISEMKSDGVPTDTIIARLMKAYNYTREDARQSIDNYELTESLF